MTPADEHRLYLSDRTAWAALAAPRWVRMLKDSNERERRELWAMAHPELRAEIRKIAQAEPASERGFTARRPLTQRQQECLDGAA